MDINFWGIQRSRKTHQHKARISEFKPLKIRASVRGLNLGGDFNVTIEFSETEMKSMLQEYVQDNPENAIRMLAEMQAEATLALLQKLKIHVHKSDAE
jgi:hypothetical protein